jgi:hypothetical protein
VHLK